MTKGTLITHVLKMRFVAVWTRWSDAPMETKTNHNDNDDDDDTMRF